MTRSAQARALALELGATFAGGAEEQPPDPLDAAILFAPAGGLVPVALRALDRGGTLAVAGIHLSDIPPLHYADELFEERQLRSVTANTRADGEEFFRIAAEIPLRPTTVAVPVRGRGPGPAGPGGGPDHRSSRAAHGRDIARNHRKQVTAPAPGTRFGASAGRPGVPAELVLLARPEQHLLDAHPHQHRSRATVALGPAALSPGARRGW